MPENVTTKKGASQKGNEDGFSFSSGLKRGGGFAEVGPTGRRIFLLQEIDWEDVRMAARGEQRGPTRFRRNISSEKGVQKFPSKDEGKEKKPNKRIRDRDRERSSCRCLRTSSISCIVTRRCSRITQTGMNVVHLVRATSTLFSRAAQRCSAVLCGDCMLKTN